VRLGRRNGRARPIIDQVMRYELWRQDDNGNRARIAVFATEAEAERERAMYEARGHKQMYWVERAEDAAVPKS
jgi:hypothetical protein